MSHYELTITPTYAKEWTVLDAVRELFQNALDQQTSEPDNAMFFEYDDGMLRIGNKHSVLEAKSLLLGSTTKANDASTIGQFGEGYKIAMLVLTRDSFPMTIYNYGKKETWAPRFKKSRKYGTDILCVDTSKHVWSAPPHNNLVIEISGISTETYEDIVENNMHLQSALEPVASTQYGEVLDKDKYSGMIFVNGLFVTKMSELTYGYNFKPEYLPLGRDRNMVKTFDIQWLTSSLWREAKDCIEIVHKLLLLGAHDVEYLTSSYNGSTQLIKDYTIQQFVLTHGANAVPVVDQYSLNEVNTKYRDAVPVIVPKALKAALGDYQAAVTLKEEAIDPLDKLDMWYEKAKLLLPIELQEEFEEVRECL